MSALIVPVVLAGGQGTRLWPMSRSARPKQFLALTGESSPFQETLRRVSDPSRYAAPIVITNSEYRFLVAEQAQELGVELSGVLLEPVARNTTPAIAAAAFFAAARFGPDSVLHVLPSDHSVVTDDNYWQSIDLAAAAARAGRLVTFGIAPTAPETGYGYIEAGAASGEGVHAVARFVEKPDLANAERMLAAGGFYWNSGMFATTPLMRYSFGEWGFVTALTLLFSGRSSPQAHCAMPTKKRCSGARPSRGSNFCPSVAFFQAM